MCSIEWQLSLGCAKQKGILHVIRVQKVDRQQMWRRARELSLLFWFTLSQYFVSSPKSTAYQLPAAYCHGFFSLWRILQYRRSEQVREYDEIVAVLRGRTSTQRGDHWIVAGSYCTLLMLFLSCWSLSSWNIHANTRVWVWMSSFQMVFFSVRNSFNIQY